MCTRNLQINDLELGRTSTVVTLESQVASAELDLNHYYYELIVTIAFGAAHALRLPLLSQHDCK
jgi:hypothetical protein